MSHREMLHRFTLPESSGDGFLFSIELIEIIDPIIGIDASERRFRNLFVEGMISEKVNDISAIIPAIKRKLYE